MPARLEGGGAEGGTVSWEDPALNLRVITYSQRTAVATIAIHAHPEKWNILAPLPLRCFDAKLNVCQRAELEGPAVTHPAKRCINTIRKKLITKHNPCTKTYIKKKYIYTLGIIFLLTKEKRAIPYLTLCFPSETRLLQPGGARALRLVAGLERVRRRGAARGPCPSPA